MFEDLDKLNLSQISISEPPVAKKVETTEVKAKVNSPSPASNETETALDLAASKLKENLSFLNFLQPMSKLGLVSKLSSNKAESSPSHETKNDVDNNAKKSGESIKSKQTIKLKNVNPTRSADHVVASKTEEIVVPDTSILPPGHQVDVSLPPPPLRLPLKKV